MLASLQRFDGNFDVPVIRSHNTDQHRYQRVPEPYGNPHKDRFPAANIGVVIGFLRLVFIHIAQEQECRHTAMPVRIPSTHATQSNAADPRRSVQQCVGKSV